jgi:hypothetical protein
MVLRKLVRTALADLNSADCQLMVALCRLRRLVRLDQIGDALASCADPGGNQGGERDDKWRDQVVSDRACRTTGTWCSQPLRQVVDVSPGESSHRRANYFDLTVLSA